MAWSNNRMGTEPVGRLLVGMSAPIICSMMVQALYNVVDSLFVAHVSGTALAAVALVFPYQLLMIALATGSGVGISVALAGRLGARDGLGARRVALSSLVVGTANFALLGIAGLAFGSAFLAAQAPAATIIDDGASYMSIIAGGSLGYFLSVALERLLQAMGKTVHAMVMSVTGAVLNIALDPILIFGLFGAPILGVAGAAIATVASQTIAMIVGLILNLVVNREVFRPDEKRADDAYSDNDVDKCGPTLDAVLLIYRLGFPSFVIQTAGSLATFLLNQILLSFTVDAVSVFAICSRLQNFFFMAVWGWGNGMIPVLSFNRSARNRARVEKAVSVSVATVLGITSFGMTACLLFTSGLLGLFDASDAMLAIGLPALRIYALSFPLEGFCAVSSSAFQALGKGSWSTALTLARQFALAIPCAWALSVTSGLDALWWTFAIAGAVTAIPTAILLRHWVRRASDSSCDEALAAQ